MGWGSGGELAEDVWKIIAPHLSAEAHAEVAAKLVEAFAMRDCDTLEEVSGPIGDAANRRRCERDGASANPAEGELWECRYGSIVETFRFDGKRWRYVSDRKVGP